MGTRNFSNALIFKFWLQDIAKLYALQVLVLGKNVYLENRTACMRLEKTKIPHKIGKKSAYLKKTAYLKIPVYNLHKFLDPIQTAYLQGSALLEAAYLKILVKVS